MGYQLCWACREREEVSNFIPSHFHDSSRLISHTGYSSAYSIIETANAELAEELGITVSDGDLEFAFIIPAEQFCLGGCNAYEHVYFIQWKHKNESQLSLGTEEVSEVSWIQTTTLLDALANGDDKYAPRTKQYVDAMRAFLQRCCD